MRHRAILGLILILALVLRLSGVGSFPLTGDESINAIRSFWIGQGITHLSWQYFYGLVVHTHSPVELILPVPFLLTRFSEFTARLPTVLLGTSVPLIFIWLYRKVFGQKTLFLGALVLAVSPFLVGWSRIDSFPQAEMAVSLGLIYSLNKLWEKPTSKSLLTLGLVYAFSLLIMMDFVLLVPLVFGSVVLLRKEFSLFNLFKTLGIFLLITGIFFVPYVLVGRLIVPPALGINYNFGRSFQPQPWHSFVYYLSTYFSHPSVWLLFIPFLLGLLVKSLRQKIFFRLISVYVVSYLAFYIFIYGRTQAYLYGIYIPIFLGGLLVLGKLAKPGRYFAALVAVIFFVITVQSLKNQTSGSPAIFGFGHKSELPEVAYLIRKCTQPQERIISDLDGFQTSLYFDRRYYNEQDRIGLAATIRKYGSETGASYVAGKLSLKNCSPAVLPSDSAKFYQEYWDKGKVISFYR